MWRKMDQTRTKTTETWRSVAGDARFRGFDDDGGIEIGRGATEGQVAGV